VRELIGLAAGAFLMYMDGGLGWWMDRLIKIMDSRTCRLSSGRCGTEVVSIVLQWVEKGKKENLLSVSCKPRAQPQGIGVLNPPRQRYVTWFGWFTIKAQPLAGRK